MHHTSLKTSEFSVKADTDSAALSDGNAPEMSKDKLKMTFGNLKKKKKRINACRLPYI